MRRLISLICAGWLPHDLNPPRASSVFLRACNLFRDCAQGSREDSPYRFSPRSLPSLFEYLSSLMLDWLLNYFLFQFAKSFGSLAIAQMKPAISRAIAMTVFCFGFPLSIIFLYRP